MFCLESYKQSQGTTNLLFIYLFFRQQTQWLIVRNLRVFFRARFRHNSLGMFANKYEY